MLSLCTVVSAVNCIIYIYIGCPILLPHSQFTGTNMVYFCIHLWYMKGMCKPFKCQPLHGHESRREVLCFRGSLIITICIDGRTLWSKWTSLNVYIVLSISDSGVLTWGPQKALSISRSQSLLALNKGICNCDSMWAPGQGESCQSTRLGHI